MIAATVFVNMFLKHVANIVFKLQKLQVLEKNFFKKKSSFGLFVEIPSSKWCAETFLKQMNPNILRIFCDFVLSKLFFAKKFINKTQTKKDLERSTHRFKDAIKP